MVQLAVFALLCRILCRAARQVDAHMFIVLRQICCIASVGRRHAGRAICGPFVREEVRRRKRDIRQRLSHRGNMCDQPTCNNGSTPVDRASAP
jgi:hypothetical protein